MTDQLSSADVDKTPAAVLTKPPTSADGQIVDNEYLSEEEIDKPIILELGSARTGSGLHSGSYSNEYPIHMHLDTPDSYSISVQRPTYSTSTAHGQSVITTMYSNPYAQSSPPLTTLSVLQTASPACVSLHYSGNQLAPTAYSSNAPQTNYASSTADVEIKLTPEVVPPPMYISYVGAPEQHITKGSNPSWRERALQNEKDYKKTACDRERTRMRDMNRAFDLLRSKLPISKPNGKKYSKIESLRIAINYINHLQQCLKDNPSSSESTPQTYSSKSNQTADGGMESNLRRRSQTLNYDLRKSSYEDTDRDLEESRNETWGDGYIPNGQDQWD